VVELRYNNIIGLEYFNICMLVFLKERTSLSNSHRRRNLIGYKNFSEGALPLVSCLFTISAVCLLLLLVLAGKFKLLVLVAS